MLAPRLGGHPREERREARLLGAAVLCLLVFVYYMYSREKQGKPIFTNIEATGAKTSA